MDYFAVAVGTPNICVGRRGTTLLCHDALPNQSSPVDPPGRCRGSTAQLRGTWWRVSRCCRCRHRPGPRGFGQLPVERPRTVEASLTSAMEMPVDQTPPPDDRDDQTQARHVATRAELLPEERAVGSDDAQAQAKVMLEESEERTDHPDPDPDASSQ